MTIPESISDFPTTSIYCLSVLLIGGALKGAIGLGLPQIGVSLMALVLGLKESLSILVLPLIVSNISQSCNPKLFIPVLRRFSLLLLPMFVFSALSVGLFGLIPERTVMLWLGLIVIVLPLVAFFRPEFRLTRNRERWVGPFVGAVAGVIGGLSTLSGPPLMIYLACLRLPKEEFVVAVSQMFLTASAGLTAGLILFGLSRPTELAVSAAACIPVLLGMWVGSKARVRMSERLFAILVLFAYLLTGSTFIAKAFWQ